MESCRSMPSYFSFNMCVVVVGLHTRNEFNQPYVLSVHKTSLYCLRFLRKLSRTFFLANLKRKHSSILLSCNLSCFYCAVKTLYGSGLDQVPTNTRCVRPYWISDVIPPVFRRSPCFVFIPCSALIHFAGD